MENGNVLEVTVSYNIVGASNPAINVYHLEVEDLVGITTLQEVGPDIRTAFVAKFITPMLVFQHTGAVYQGLSIINLNSIAEYYVTPLTGIAGGRVGGFMPPFVTYSFQETRPNRLIRNGRKGIGGVSQVVTDDGITLNATYQPLMNTMLSGWNLMTMNVEGDLDFQLRDVIVRKNPAAGGAPSLVLDAQRWVFRGFGSQNTRK